MPNPMPVPKEADRLARVITELVKRNPGDRSLLRHSLSLTPEEVAVGVHRIIVPLLPKDTDHDPQAERAYYAVAALIAAQPRPARDQAGTEEAPEGDTGEAVPGIADDGKPGGPARSRNNLGYSLARAIHAGGNAKSLEDRLQLLARQDAEGVYRHLPRLILQLRGDQVRIDWGVLIRDLARWERAPRQVAKEWAQDFYRTDERLTAEEKRNADQASSTTDNEEA